MAGTIKGITIEFQGDTTKLDSAMRSINQNTRSLDTELRKVNNALKFNPTSVELWHQKQTILTQKINETKTKLDVLKQAQAKLDADKSVDKNSEDYRELQREIIETESKLSNYKNQLKQVGNVNLRAASEQLKEIGSKATAAGQAMTPLSRAAAVLVAGIGALTVKAGQWADDLITLQKQYHLNTKELQLYSAAADLVDVDVNTIAKSHVKLTRSMAAAQSGTKAQSEAFKKLGISVTDANGNLRDGDEVWQETIKALSEIENPTERDAIAMQLFGKSASELNPLIEDGGETYKEFAETLKKYDLDFIDQKTLDKANDFNDKLDTMKAVGKLAFQSLGAALAEKLAPFLDKAVEAVGKFAKWLADLNPTVVLIITVIAGLVAAIAPLLLAFGALASAAGAIAGVLAGISAPVLGVVAAVGALVAIFGTALGSSDKLRKAVGDIVKEFGNALQPVIKAVIETFKSLIGTVKETIKSVADQLAPVLEQLKPVFQVIAKIIQTVLMLALKKLKSDIEVVCGVVKVLVTIFTTAFSAVVSVVTSAYNSIKTLCTNIAKSLDFKAILDTLKSLFLAAFKAVVTTISNAVNSIKTLATNIANALNFANLVTAIKTAFETIKTGIITAITNAKTKLSEIVNQIKTVVNFDSLITSVKATFESIKTAMRDKFVAAKDKVKEIVGQIKTVVNFDSIESSVKSKFESIKNAIRDKFVAAKDKVKEIVGQIKSVVDFGNLVDGVKKTFNSIKEKITGPIESAKEKITGFIDKVKGVFPISLGKIFSGIKLPHFKISGGKIPWGIGGMGEKPTVTIDWYAKGGIFNAPNVIGVGEAGPEAVVPLDKFWKKIDNLTGGGDSFVVNVYGSDNMNVQELAEAVEQRIIMMQKRRKEAW